MKKKEQIANLVVIDTSGKPQCGCGHREGMHYGTDARHCNSQGCSCEAWEPC